MSEITTETIPSVLILNNNDEILIAVRQPYISTYWIWTSTKKGRIQLRWQTRFVDTDYGRTQFMDGDKKCQDENHWGECWTIDDKKNLRTTGHTSCRTR